MDPHGRGGVGLIIAVLTENQIALIEVHRGQTDQLAAAELAHLQGRRSGRSKTDAGRWRTGKRAHRVSQSVCQSTQLARLCRLPELSVRTPHDQPLPFPQLTDRHDVVGLCRVH